MRNLIFAIFILSINRNHVHGVMVPPSPCPDIFRYESSNINEVHGVISLMNDYSGYYKMEINMTLAAFTNQNIGVKLVTPNVAIQNGEDLKYHITFPPANDVPQVASIVLNEKMYCSALNQGRPNFGYTSLNAVNYFGTSIRVRPPPKPFTPSIIPVEMTPVTQTVPQTFRPVTSSNPVPIITTQGNPATPKSEPQQFNSVVVVTQPTPKAEPQTQSVIIVTEKPAVSKSEIKQETKTTMSSKDVYTSQIKVTSETTINISSPIKNRYFDFVDCGVADDIQPLVVQGLPTTEGQFPWLVAMFHLQESGEYKFKCAANLVSDKHVITAAHCVRIEKVYSVSKENIILVLGRHNIRKWAVRSEIRDVKEIYIHPQYLKPSDADIAVMVMYKKVEFTSTIKPVCLWSEEKGENIMTGEGTVVGWGRDEYDNSYVPEPRQLNMPIVSQEECLRSDDRFLRITSNRTFCAGRRNGEGPCTGDSGGGFIMRRKGRWTLRGIVSAALVDLTTRSCDVNNYMVFSDVSKYMSWIDSIMNK